MFSIFSGIPVVFPPKKMVLFPFGPSALRQKMQVSAFIFAWYGEDGTLLRSNVCLWHELIVFVCIHDRNIAPWLFRGWGIGVGGRAWRVGLGLDRILFCAEFCVLWCALREFLSTRLLNWLKLGLLIQTNVLVTNKSNFNLVVLFLVFPFCVETHLADGKCSSCLHQVYQGRCYMIILSLHRTDYVT